MIIRCHFFLFQVESREAKPEGKKNDDDNNNNDDDNDDQKDDDDDVKDAHSDLSRTNALIHADVDVLMAPYKEEKVAAKSQTAVCPICRKTVMRRKLKEHIVIHSEQQFRCHLCQKTFHRKYNLDRHLAFHARVGEAAKAGVKTGDNKDCNEESVRRKSRTVDAAESQCFEKVEEEEDVSRSSENDNAGADRAVDSYKDDIANARRRVESQNDGNATAQCTDRTVKPGPSERTIVRLVDGPLDGDPERIYDCDLCPKAFKNKSHLEEHITTHSDERPHPCSLCPKVYISVLFLALLKCGELKQF